MNRTKKYKAFYYIIGIAGIFLMIFQVDIYRSTIIPVKIPLIVVLFGTVVGFLITYKNYNNTYQTKRLLYPLLQSLCSFGFITCYIFMALNYYCADKEIENRLFAIYDISTMGSKYPKPVFNIDYDGFEKQLVLSNSQLKDVKSTKEVMLIIRKGLFGFDVISDLQLK